jgi:phage tail tape-measure protein
MTPRPLSSAPLAPSPKAPKGSGRIASVLALIELVREQYRLHQAVQAGEVPREAYWSETAGNVGKVAGGLGGSLGGAALGTVVAPGMGTIVGGALGGLAGSTLGRNAAKWLKSRFAPPPSGE